MKTAQEQVRLFHEKMAYPTADTPGPVSREMARQRYAFILEELNEYRMAALEEDLVGTADALADILYVVLGTAVVHGINLAPIFAEVHRSNMTKDQLNPITKKGGKGPGYEKPRIGELLLIQATGSDAACAAAEGRVLAFKRHTCGDGQLGSASCTACAE